MIFFCSSGRADSVLPNADCRVVKKCKYGFATADGRLPSGSNANTLAVH